jgi:hypothetical protein
MVGIDPPHLKGGRDNPCDCLVGLLGKHIIKVVHLPSFTIHPPKHFFYVPLGHEDVGAFCLSSELRKAVTAINKIENK